MDSSEDQVPGPGTVLGSFTIDEEIGSGAMGSVFRGTDRRDGSRVAIKVMNPELNSDPTFRQRFEREAHLATLLKSPYTVRVLDFGRAGRWYYLVMEFVEGDSVGAMLQAGPIPLLKAIEIACDGARALEALATQNIVHRDLKPGNIIVNPDGAAKLVDFGISQQANSRDRHASFVGTVQYAAPEQQDGRADQRTDIYALGATLFHMLAGRPPYTGRTDEEVLRQHVHAPFPAPLLSWHPEPVVDVVRRCMQKDPEDRYQTASELAGALDRLLARLATYTPPPSRLGAPGGPALVPEPEEEDSGGSGTLVLAPRAATPNITVPPPRTPTAPEPEPEEAANPGTVVFPVPPPSAYPTTAPGASAPTIVPPAQPPAADRAVAAAPPPVPEPAGGGGKKGIIAAALGVLVLAGAGAVALLVLGGGGGDDKAAAGEPTATVATTTVTAVASATAASPTVAATATPTTEPTATPAPTEAPTATPVPATPTRAAATTPPQPTPTPVPAGSSITIRGFVIGGDASSAPAVGANGGTLSGTCGVDLRVLLSFTGLPAGSILSSSWTRDGGATGAFTGPLPPLTGNGSASFPHPAQAPGLYRVSISGGGASAAGSVSFSC
ncbi:MAG: serine/threonine protein kinase [Dehalococcoidia bacterium]|nr:serine/threonine protein kinase [Dehalococcoidia bacterium]